MRRICTQKNGAISQFGTENFTFPPKRGWYMDRRTDICFYRVALLLKKATDTRIFNIYQTKNRFPFFYKKKASDLEIMCPKTKINTLNNLIYFETFLKSSFQYPNHPSMKGSFVSDINIFTIYWVYILGWWK